MKYILLMFLVAVILMPIQRKSRVDNKETASDRAIQIEFGRPFARTYNSDFGSQFGRRLKGLTYEQSLYREFAR